MPTSPSTLQMVLDAPTWSNIRSQLELDTRRRRLETGLAMLGVAAWIAPVLAGALVGWMAWEHIIVPHVAELGVALNTLAIAVLTIAAVFAACVTFCCVDFIHSRVEAKRLVLRPLGIDEAIEMLDWCAHSQDVDAYRLHVITDAARELCLGDYQAVVMFREAQEDRDQAQQREIQATRALNKLAARSPVWTAPPIRRLTGL